MSIHSFDPGYEVDFLRLESEGGKGPCMLQAKFGRRRKLLYSERHKGVRYLFGEYLIGFPLMGNGKASILQGLMEEDDQLLKMRDSLWRRAIRGNLE